MVIAVNGVVSSVSTVMKVFLKKSFKMSEQAVSGGIFN